MYLRQPTSLAIRPQSPRRVSALLELVAVAVGMALVAFSFAALVYVVLAAMFAPQITEVFSIFGVSTG